MAKSLQNLLKHQHILLIQGKMGNFFSRFSSFLQKKALRLAKLISMRAMRFFIDIRTMFITTKIV